MKRGCSDFCLLSTPELQTLASAYLTICHERPGQKFSEIFGQAKSEHATPSKKTKGGGESRAPEEGRQKTNGVSSTAARWRAKKASSQAPVTFDGLVGWPKKTKAGVKKRCREKTAPRRTKKKKTQKKSKHQQQSHTTTTTTTTRPCGARNRPRFLFKESVIRKNNKNDHHHHQHHNNNKTTSSMSAALLLHTLRCLGKSLRDFFLFFLEPQWRRREFEEEDEPASLRRGTRRFPRSRPRVVVVVGNDHGVPRTTISGESSGGGGGGGGNGNGRRGVGKRRKQRNRKQRKKKTKMGRKRKISPSESPSNPALGKEKTSSEKKTTDPRPISGASALCCFPTQNTTKTTTTTTTAN